MIRPKRLAFAMTGLILASTLALTYAVPPVAAAICPPCYGLHQIAPRIYSDIPDTAIAPIIDAARGHVRNTWGPLQSNPFVLICTTPACDHRLGGKGARGMTYGAWVVHLSPHGANQTIAAHELAHAELHQRIGIFGLWQDRIPAWLNEGIAVLISQDARYLGRPKDCLGVTVDSLPPGANLWSKRAQTEHDLLYTQAACAADSWLAARGGIGSLPELFP